MNIETHYQIVELKPRQKKTLPMLKSFLGDSVTFGEGVLVNCADYSSAVALRRRYHGFQAALIEPVVSIGNVTPGASTTDIAFSVLAVDPFDPARGVADLVSSVQVDVVRVLPDGGGIQAIVSGSQSFDGFTDVQAEILMTVDEVLTSGNYEATVGLSFQADASPTFIAATNALNTVPFSLA